MKHRETDLCSLHAIISLLYIKTRRKAKVKSAIEVSLNEDLPDSYDADSFHSKIDLLMNHFIDMAVQGYGWIAA